MKFAPKLIRKYQTECHGDLADELLIQNYAADTDTAKKLNDSTNKGKIKDYGMERTYINEWRSYLTNAD